MKPLFANSAFVTVPERLYMHGGRWQRVPLKVRYGLFRHPVAGLVLIDTGYGPRVTQGPRSLPLRLYNAVLGPTLVKDGEPEAVLATLGFTPADIELVILTHFHADHVAGLDRFPHARIIAAASVLADILARPTRQNLRHGIFTELFPADLAKRTMDIGGFSMKGAPLGLGAGRDIFGDGSLLAVDLRGHAEGHFGLCFAELAIPLLYAVDVQWCGEALEDHRRPGFPSSLIAEDRSALAESTRRVRSFREAGGDVLLCHDPAISPYDHAGWTS